MNNRIRELREKRRMSQIHLSIELEISQETVSAYETGRHFPSYDSLVKLSKIFNASIDYIMGLSDVRNNISEKCLSNDEAELLALYKRLSSAQKEKSVAYLRGMYDAM